MDPEDRGALNVAIRSLMNAIDTQETLIRYEQGIPQKRTSRDYDTFEQRKAHLNAIMGEVKPEELGSDPNCVMSYSLRGPVLPEVSRLASRLHLYIYVFNGHNMERSTL